jgi:hypothetical protein
VRTNYKDRYACAVGYLTAETGNPKLL